MTNNKVPESDDTQQQQQALPALTPLYATHPAHQPILYPTLQARGPDGNAYPAQDHFISMIPMEEPMPVRWSWGNMVLSIFSLFCCWCLGTIAVISSMLAYTDHKARDYKRSFNKRQFAKGFAIAAIVFGSLIAALAIIYYTVIISVLVKTAMKEADQENYDYYNDGGN